MSKNKSDIERSDELIEEVGHLPEPTDLPDEEELADLFADELEDGFCEECGDELDLDGDCPNCLLEDQYDDGDDWPRRDRLDFNEDYD